ncbi:phage holin family protein [Bacillus tamaricis]|uniref:Phage holin family protein n=1 Tax=Evansella tamaricis TaxID=2069301 RepID=A0ABS6J8Y0_9BACI|nr:phage holin family protein [Evansella tamaricis]
MEWRRKRVDLLEYIVEDALILIPVLMIIGKMLKDTPKIMDWTIPYLLLILGVVLSVLIMGVSIDSFIQGILVTGAAVFTHQLVKQTRKQLKSVT